MLNSNEPGAGFVCTLDKKPAACAAGATSLTNLRSGPHQLTAQAVDAAGNADQVPSKALFFVPANLKASPASGWRRMRNADGFDGDLVRAGKVGATLRIGRQRRVHEVRLIAPAGPRMGRIEVRVGRSQWYTVDLSGKAAAHKTYVVRDQFAPPQSGAILIRVLSLPPRGSVQLDALVAR